MSESGPYAASVVFVCDYASNTEAAVADMRRAFKAVAAQDIAEPIEYILTESEELRGWLPPDILGILPSLRVVYSPARGSCDLRNHGVREASCEVVATLDADCQPNRSWLRHILEDLRDNPDVAAVSGWTRYAGNGFMSRSAGAIERSYMKGDAVQTTPHLSTNSAGFRRSVFLEHDVPTHVGPFAGRLQGESIRRAGWRLLFDPRMRVQHAFAPGFYSTYHYNAGFATVRLRQENDRLPYAWLARLRYFSLPFFFGGRLFRAWQRALTSWRDYGVRWYEVPATFVVATWGCLIEVPGMLRALRGEGPPATLFR